MSAKLRRRILLGSLAIVVALILFDKVFLWLQNMREIPAKGPVMFSEREGQAIERGKQSGLMIQEIQLRIPTAPAGNAFETPDWTSTPPARSALPSTLPGASATPPLLLTFLGKKYEDGSWVVFVGWQDEVYIVKEKDVISNAYRVDSIRPPDMTLTYLPLNQIQIMSIGEAP